MGMFAQEHAIIVLDLQSLHFEQFHCSLSLLMYATHKLCA